MTGDLDDLDALKMEDWIIRAMVAPELEPM
jgi:hypothetical protein